jgi:hypothetical protein
VKRGFVVLGVLFSSLAAWAAELPESLERPLRELRATFDAELAAAGSDGSARFRAFEKGFEEVEAALSQLSRRSAVQVLPAVSQSCPTGVLAWGRAAELVKAQRAKASDIQWIWDSKFPLSLGKGPFENAEALERYRDFGDLPTGPLSMEVTQRLRVFLDHVERAYFGADADLGDDAELTLPHAFLRHRSRILLPAFVIAQRLSGEIESRLRP